MKPHFEKNAGIALIVFTVLMVFTMILHPVGGSFEHLVKVKSMIITAHAIALLSLPFALVGFRGLTKTLGSDDFFSITAFATMVFGLIAVLMAATANGLILPVFISRYEGSSAEVIESIKPVLKYNFSANNAFDIIYTAAFCLAMLFWSVTILRTGKLPVWIAYLGMLSAAAGALIFASGLVQHLQGFRMFTVSVIIWILLVGIQLMRNRKVNTVS